MRLRLVGLAALVLALGGIWGSSLWLGGLLFQGGLEQIGTRAGADYGFLLLVANALDLLAYGGLAFAGFGFLTSRGWSRRAGFYVGYYFAVMMPVEVLAEYLSVVRPTLERMRAAGLPAPPAAAILLHFTGAALMLALAAVLILLGSRRSGRKASLVRQVSPDVLATAGSRMAFWSTKKPTTHTNAPRHWPRIEVDQFDNPGVNRILIGGQLASLHKPPGSRVAFLQDFLYEDGILRVPLVVEEGTQKTCVFVYSNHEKDAAAHYSGVRALLRSRENAGAVYYAPEALAPVKAGTVLQPIDTPFFSVAEPQGAEAFALWWATEEAPKLAGSEERSSLDRWFEAIDGYGFLILTAFLKDLDLVEDEKGVYALPAQPLLQPLMGPGQTRMLLHASAPEGLFLAFDESTPARQRRLLLKLLADFAVEYRRAIEAKGLAPREDEKGRGLARWRAIRDAALAKEATGGAGLKLHAVTVRDVPTRDPDATTAEDRAAQPQGLGREELDFGADLLDRVIARLKNKPSAGSTQAELGLPNFAPVVAAKVGPDVFERQLPYEDMAVAQAAAGRVLDEWPDAKIVAVIADAAIREDGERTDIFDVKIENCTTRRASALFQRYRVAKGGGLELIGRPMAMPAESFVLEPSASREPAPDQALTALARQALDTIVASLTIVEPSGMCGDDPEDALLSPSALIGVAGDPRPHTVRFMMQGPITAAICCYASLQEKPAAEWAVFHIDDLVSKNGSADRRLRLCLQRRQDAGVVIFDQHYETPRKGMPFALRGGLEFKRWAGSMFPPPDE